ncbi:hypothetical protein CPC08DRAFT_727609 [Agrocybe pediades]|nr:hypothetical protein CPC08DRAFT_727609 [Agrocybe pediades]
MAQKMVTRQGYGGRCESEIRMEHGYLGSPLFLPDAAWLMNGTTNEFNLRTADLDDAVECCIVGKIPDDPEFLTQFTFDIALRNFDLVLDVFWHKDFDPGFVKEGRFTFPHRLFKVKNTWKADFRERTKYSNQSGTPTASSAQAAFSRQLSSIHAKIGRRSSVQQLKLVVKECVAKCGDNHVHCICSSRHDILLSNSKTKRSDKRWTAIAHPRGYLNSHSLLLQMSACLSLQSEPNMPDGMFLICYGVDIQSRGSFTVTMVYSDANTADSYTERIWDQLSPYGQRPVFWGVFHGNRIRSNSTIISLCSYIHVSKALLVVGGVVRGGTKRGNNLVIFSHLYAPFAAPSGFRQSFHGNYRTLNCKEAF